MERLGHYRINAVLGQGAMGTVYRAVDERLDRTVALKVLKLDLNTDDRAEYAARLQQEARSAARLNHPNIITVYDCGDIDGYAYLAIEYVEGKTLESYIAGGLKVSVSKTIKLAGQLFGALAYAHEHQVVHRDIKPGNLMLTADGRLKITDFGIAQLPASDLTRAGTLVGSPRYMAPEQIEGKKLDGRADVFAAGIVLYQLLTGVRPFDGDHVATIAYRILHEQPTRPRELASDLPPWLDDFVMRCLEKDPAKRFQSAREARHALREQATASPVKEPTAPPEPQVHSTETVSPAQRSTSPKWRLLGIGSIVVALLGAGALMMRNASNVSAKPNAAVPSAPITANQVELMAPPGAPGSLPAAAAMPVREVDSTPVNKTPASTENSTAVDKATASSQASNAPQASAKPTRKASAAKPAPVASEKPQPAEPSHSPKPTESAESKPKQQEKREKPPAVEDKRNFLEVLAGCKPDGTCPKPAPRNRRER
ncbi:serine/threonine-protein kinase [Chitinimonas sp. BJYL2]|uniref:serine/threonine-protein kinase n=1 Tax=Chitinimonas sp. BJYL2 TaxID=2976696 RepID=UPI0022B35BFA|nr:serine/threonine-protein kinase [Chitinimonas sp. BJYL2]